VDFLLEDIRRRMGLVTWLSAKLEAFSQPECFRAIDPQPWHNRLCTADFDF